MESKEPMEVFAKIVKHQRKQKKKCKNPYKTNWEGKLCIAYKELRDPLGVVISKPFLGILHKIEGDLVWHKHIKALLEIEGSPPVSLRLIYDLQKIHDLKKVREWEDEWQQISVLYDIPMPEKGGQEVFPFMGHLIK